MTISQISGAFAITWMIALALSVALGLKDLGLLSFSMMAITTAIAAMTKSIEEDEDNSSR